MTTTSVPVGEARATLAKEMGLLGLVATGVCSMVGAGINVVPIMVQRNVPGIGPHVVLAFAIAMIPAVLAALAYAVMASGMPRAGGSYVYASRSLHPYLGFLASFSQWLGLSVAMGVVAYVVVPFLRDIALSIGFSGLAAFLESGAARVSMALLCLWSATVINLLGIKTFERAMIVLMVLGLLGGAIVIPAGFAFEHADFAAALSRREGIQIAPVPGAPVDFLRLSGAIAILFSSFIGFDSIAQAGSEARRPSVTLPLATFISIASVGAYYLLFPGTSSRKGRRRRISPPRDSWVTSSRRPGPSPSWDSPPSPCTTAFRE
jgi:APA family basic amino acid/polyamine antiporter